MTARDTRTWITARLLAIDTGTNRAQVSIDGGDAVWLPFVPNTYTGITVVYVLRDPTGVDGRPSGSGQLVMGPCYAESVDNLPAPPPAPPAIGVPDPLVAHALIRPTYTGTYRVSKGAWDRWNVNRDDYGGRASLYQGADFGSGTLKGLATYGDQVVNLGALTIEQIVVLTPVATGAGNVTLQGSPDGTRPAGAPSSSGTVNAGLTAVALDATTAEGFRAGTVKGLAAVGANYRAVFGTSTADGMALSITYTRQG